MSIEIANGRLLHVINLHLRAPLAEFSSLEVHNETLGDELVAYTCVEDSPQSYHAPVVAEFKTV